MSFRQSFEKLESDKAKVLLDVSNWSEERLRFHPDSASWSTLAVLDHLVKVESAALTSLQRNLSANNPVGLKERIGAQIVLAVMRSPIRVKVPATATMVIPDPAASLADIRERWSSVRREMATLIQGSIPNGGVFRHPVSGWMTFPNAITFLVVHLRHHGSQLKKLARASSGVQA